MSSRLETGCNPKPQELAAMIRDYPSKDAYALAVTAYYKDCSDKFDAYIEGNKSQERGLAGGSNGRTLQQAR